MDLTVPDSSLMLPIMGTLLTYTSLELAKMKGATGWIKACPELFCQRVDFEPCVEVMVLNVQCQA